MSRILSEKDFVRRRIPDNCLMEYRILCRFRYNGECGVVPNNIEKILVVDKKRLVNQILPTLAWWDPNLKVNISIN